MMNRDGTELVHWNIGGDLEAITVADHTSNFVYIGVESPDSVYEFDVSSGQDNSYIQSHKLDDRSQ